MRSARLFFCTFLFTLVSLCVCFLPAGAHGGASQRGDRTEAKPRSGPPRKGATARGAGFLGELALLPFGSSP